MILRQAQNKQCHSGRSEESWRSSWSERVIGQDSSRAFNSLRHFTRWRALGMTRPQVVTTPECHSSLHSESWRSSWPERVMGQDSSRAFNSLRHFMRWRALGMTRLRVVTTPECHSSLHSESWRSSWPERVMGQDSSRAFEALHRIIRWRALGMTRCVCFGVHGPGVLNSAHVKCKQVYLRRAPAFACHKSHCA
jgi:hypothetical protein